MSDQHTADAYDAYDADQPLSQADYDGAEQYLHDGLYAQYDGYQFRLRAPRGEGDHVVYLDPKTLSEFARFVRRMGVVL